MQFLKSELFDCHSVMDQGFLSIEETVNKTYYLGVMRSLHEAVRKKQPEL